MKLSAQVAAVTAALVVGTAALIGAASYVLTRNGFDTSIDRSIESVIGPVGTDLSAAQAVCGIEEKNRRGPGGGGPRRPNRDVIVQCLAPDGTIIATSPTKLLPVSDADREVAAGTSDRNSPHSATVEVDDEHLRVVTVGVEGLGAVQAARSVNERDRVLASLLARIALVAAAAVLLASAAGAAVARRIAKPIVALTNAAEQIDRTGDLDAAVVPPAASGEETKRLTHAFTGMVGSLRASRDAQARLVQDAGHELRTPLTSIRTNVSLLRRADLPADRRNGILADLDSELRELTAITNELVSLAGDGARNEVASTIDLGEMATASAARWSRRSDRLISAQINASASCDVTAGVTSLQRAVDNLISNAVKFSPPGSPVEVSVDRAGAQVVFTVTDHGPGIPVADLGRIFERFYRSDEARSVSGSGLGLSIVADFAKSAGGSVAALNKPGGGAVFTLTLPAV